MTLRIWTKVVAVGAIALLAVSATPSFAATANIGMVANASGVTVNQKQAPSGTTVFSNDKVEAANALINLKSGGMVEMIGAAATFLQEGDTLVITPSRGLLSFNLQDGEKIRVDSACSGVVSADLNGKMLDVDKCTVTAAPSAAMLLAILAGAGVAGAAVGIGIAVSGGDEASPSSR